MVALESSYQFTPSRSRTHWQRCARPAKVRRLDSMASIGKPTACPRANAARALDWLCEPRIFSSRTGIRFWNSNARYFSPFSSRKPKALKSGVFRPKVHTGWFSASNGRLRAS
ncbi:hypothetical protein D3C77_499990 [compost metagenome]